MVPPEYTHYSVICNLDAKSLFIGRDGPIVSEGDLAYDVMNQKVKRLDDCIGYQHLHVHEGGFSMAPCFITLDDDHVFASNLLLLKREGCRPTRV